MKNVAVIKKGTYFDSVTLMGVSKRLSVLEGVEKVSVSMGTELNQDLLREAGMNTPETDAAGPNDLMIVLRCNDGVDVDATMVTIERELKPKAVTGAANEAAPATIRTAMDRMPEANVVLISVPGQYAAYEAQKALAAGLNVMMFSDNVSVKDEIELKKLAHSKGLLMMGPDCGTAIINQVPLCFANVVHPGHVGVVGASGTGTQEVTSLLDIAGLGISQVIGTGGRDLSSAVGGLMTIDGMRALEADENTNVVVVVAKAPQEDVMDKLVAVAKEMTKPVVFSFLSDKHFEDDGRIKFTNTLEGAIFKVMDSVSADEAHTCEGVCQNKVIAICEGLNAQQKYVRGVFCGGTLTNEARMIFAKAMPEAQIFSNISHNPAEQLADWHKSQAHTFLDMGDDTFTVGRAHPMIDPEQRNARLIQEALDPETAVVLFDVVLGFGAHADPVGAVLPFIEQAKAELAAQNRKVAFVAYVLGTDSDYQNREASIERLKAAGVTVAKTNADAARIVTAIAQQVNK